MPVIAPAVILLSPDPFSENVVAVTWALDTNQSLHNCTCFSSIICYRNSINTPRTECSKPDPRFTSSFKNKASQSIAPQLSPV